MSWFDVSRWSAHHPAGPSFFQLFFSLYLTDVSNVEGDVFFATGCLVQTFAKTKLTLIFDIANMACHPGRLVLNNAMSSWFGVRFLEAL